MENINYQKQRPHLLKISQPPGNSFIIKGDAIAWNNPWHFHPEIELLYCIRGRGTNVVGNYVAPIEEGEVLLFGKNLPHTRQRDKEFYSRNPKSEPKSIVVQFREDFLGNDFFSIDEFLEIGKFLQRAQRGIRFRGAIRKRITGSLLGLRSLKGVPAILRLISLLDEMSRSQEFDFLNQPRYAVELNDKDTQRINAVFRFVHENFHEPIRLDTVASIANLNPAAFCRYFKSRTRRTFVEYLNQVRLDHACELLTDSHLDVTQICFASGFNNLSNFNKQFRKYRQITPGGYRASVRKQD